MQQYTTTFCRRPPTILDTPTTTPTRTNRHNRCSNHKAFFCSLLRRWFWEKKLVHKDRKTMCLKAWQRKLQEEKKRLSYLLRGTKTKNRQKTFRRAFVGSMSAVALSSNFHHYLSLPSCVGEKQAFSATTNERTMNYPNRSLLVK